jgi:hypothetical protein
MQVLKEKQIKDFILVHIIFAAIVAITLLFPFPQAVISGKLLILVIIYNGLIIIEFYSKGYENWQSIWTFSIVLSLLMVFPDWYLAETLGALQFFDDGFPMLGGAIPIYMAGLWAIPFFIIIFIGKEIQQRKTLKIAYSIVTLFSLIIFALAELTLVYLPSWAATVVGMTGNLAWYIVVPEMLLGLSAFIVYDQLKDRQVWMKMIGAFTVMRLYIGNASFFFFIIETLLLGA